MSCFWSDSLMRGSRPGAPEPTLDSFTIALHFSFFPAKKMMSGKSPFEKNSNNNKNTIPTCYLYFVSMHHFYHWLDNVRISYQNPKNSILFLDETVYQCKNRYFAERVVEVLLSLLIKLLLTQVIPHQLSPLIWLLLTQVISHQLFPLHHFPCKPQRPHTGFNDLLTGLCAL